MDGATGETAGRGRRVGWRTGQYRKCRAVIKGDGAMKAEWN